MPIGTGETDRTGIPDGGTLWDHSMQDVKSKHSHNGRIKYKSPSYVVLRTSNFTTLSFGYLSEGVVN